jgi:hypothetical protein
VAGRKKPGAEPPRKPCGAGGGDPVRTTGGGRAGTGARSTLKRPPPPAKEKRLVKIGKRAAHWRKLRWKEVGTEAIEDPARRAKLTEPTDIGNVIPKLRREGFTGFYANPIRQGPRAGEMPRGTLWYGHDGFGQILEGVFRSGGRTGGPDLVAVGHRGRGRVLVVDITAGPWSTAHVPVKPGELHRQPAEIRAETEEVQHLDKTKRDAKAPASGLNGSGEFADYEVYFKGNYMLVTMKEM